MKITITRAQPAHLQDCKLALLHSRLGQEYFASAEKAIDALTEGMTRDEMFVALDENGAALGFIWFILQGAFHSFPYLHILAVRQEFRGQRIGTQLLSFFEQTVFPDSSRVFLVVADFNPDAHHLYESLGYRQVGAIPDLYKPGVTEFLMMKQRP